MATYDLNDKAMTHIILALDAHVKILEDDEDEPGPSMMDAMYLRELASKLRVEYNEKKHR